MNNISTIAIDLAKSVFQICIVSGHNKVSKQLRLSREKFRQFMLEQTPSRVVMEACYSSHYWARLFQQQGHQVLLIPAQHVTPFVRGNKNDQNDALAIYEASMRPNIRFVPIKSLGQQDVQSLHRMRERLVKDRTALCNQMRGLLTDYGYIFPIGINAVLKGLREILEQGELSGMMQSELNWTLTEYDLLSRRIDHINEELKRYGEQDQQCQNLISIPGIGAHIATAIKSTVGNAEVFHNSRDFAAWTGLTPRQKASGHKSVMSGITKRGDAYLRKLLVQAARHTLRWAKRNEDTNLARWMIDIVQRRGLHKGVVAIAHKLARIIWSVLTRQTVFNPA